MSTVGAFVAVAVMALAPTAAATSAAISLSHDVLILSYSANIQGCAKAANTVHKFSLKNGVGLASEKAKAVTCPLTRGGPSVQTYGSSYTQFGVEQNYPSLAHNYSYLNETWNISALATLSAVGKIKACPYQTQSFVGNFYNGTGFAIGYINETYQNCYSEAYLNINPEEQIDDYNTGQYWGFGFGGYYATAGAYAANYTETENFTTVGWTNVTFSCTTCWGSLGAGGTTVVSQNVNGNVTAATYGLSWSKGDHVQVYFECFVSVGVEIYNVKGGAAAASLVATGLHGHVDLTATQFA